MAWADHWTAPTEYEYPASCPVYVKLQINGAIATSDSTLELAAFIDNSCRGIVKKPTSQGVYALRVWGDDNDVNKNITFRAYYRGLEYSLNSIFSTIYSDNAIRIDLGIEAITGISTVPTLSVTNNLPREEQLSFTYEYKNANGEDIKLTNGCTLLSELDFKWNTFDASEISVSGSTLSIAGECANKKLECTVTGPVYDEEQFKVSCSTELTASYPVSFNCPGSLELDRYTKYTFTLPNLIGSIFDPSLVEFRFPSLGGVPMAVVSYEKKDGIYNFTAYGNVVGIAPYQVYYDGTLMKTEGGEDNGTVQVTATAAIPYGWSWFSLYATEDATGVMKLKNSSNEYESWVSDNIKEIRSQFELLYNDATFGFYGDINDINVAEGMYKIKASIRTTFNPGYNTSVGLALVKDIHKGYNWFNNPYQFDIPLSQIPSAINITPKSGDKIIGKSSFIEFDGSRWEGYSSFTIEAGKGYMYYSTTPGVVTMRFNPDLVYVVSNTVNKKVQMPSSAVSSARSRVPAVVETSHWSYDDSQFADNMTIVATLSDIYSPEDYSIGAFVGSECRGEGFASESGKMFINVAGKAGEMVSFKLYNKQTEEVVDLNETIKYTSVVGSLDEPVELSADVMTTGISCIRNIEQDKIMEIHDIAGRKVTEMESGIYLVSYNLNGAIVTKKIKCE